MGKAVLNKAGLIDSVVSIADVTKVVAEKVLDATLEAISHALSKGDEVSLIGFGKFKVNKREARTGRNPQTGDQIKIAARNVPAFSAGQTLKDAVNKSATKSDKSKKDK